MSQVDKKLTGGCTFAPVVSVEDPHSHLFQSLASSAKRPQIHAEVGRYRVRLAESVEDRDAACRLRFRVFNIELREGLERSYLTGMDTDDFDLFCDHLVVEDRFEGNPAKRIVGTYRLQTGLTAATNLGYYSEREFCFEPYEHLRPHVLELGRASIGQDHRTPEVLTLLWRGIAQYASELGLRYLVGCSSLNSRKPAEGWKLYSQLQKYRISREFETEPTPAFLCPMREPTEPSSEISNGVKTASDSCAAPRLLKTYLSIGARICSPPAWDREFGTIDFLTLLDLKMLTVAARNRFLAPLNP